MLEKPEKIVEQALKILAGVTAISEWCKTHPLLLAVLLVSGFIYVALRGIAYSRPEHFVDRFYEAINNKELDTAWKMLAHEYRTRRWGSIQTFKNGFTTTISHAEISSLAIDKSWNPLRMFLRARQRVAIVDASFVATDRFTASDFLHATQDYDSWWLRIRSETDFESLLNNTYISPEATATPSLELTRVFKKRFTLHKLDWKRFEIAKVDSLEEGIRRSL